MATVIQIKRSGVAGSPAELAQGELAYSYLADNGSNGGDRLYIGTGTETDGVAADIEVIGGIYFTSKYPSTFGSVEASKLLSTDSNSAINTLNIGNSTTVGGTLKLNEGTNNGTNFVAIKAPNAVTTDTTFTLPDGVGSNGQVLTTDGSTGALSWSTVNSTFTLAADSGTNDSFSTGGTLTFTGGTGIDTTVSDDQISIAIDSNVLTASSTHTLTNKTFDANGTGNSISNIEVADLASGVLDTDLASVSASDDTLASAKAIKAYVDAQNANQMTTFTISDDSSTTSTITQSDTLQFLGGTGIGSTVSGDTVTFAIDATVTTNSGTQTLTNKTISLGSNTISGTTAQFNSALSDGSFATLAGTETLTNKTINTASNTITVYLSEGTLTGTTTEFNSALSDGSFATLAGTETLAYKTLTAPKFADGGFIADSNGNAQIVFNTTASAVNYLDVTNAATGNGITLASAGGDTNIDIKISPKGSGVIDADTSRITNVTDPSGDQDAATKAYVDSVANGLDVKDSVRYASTANVAGTYDNGAGTITAGSNGAFSIDGQTPSQGDRVLLKDQSSAVQNGLYIVTTVGDGSTAYVLTRTPDADAANEITGGSFVFVEEGTANADNGYVFTHDGTPTLGTTNITVAQFSGAGQISAGDALTKTGNQLDVAVDDSTIEVSSDALQVKASGIGANELASNAVETAKINNNAVTVAKLATTLDLSSNTITLPSTFVTTTGTQTLTNKTINASQLVDGSVSNAKLANNSLSFTDESSTAGSVSLGGTLEFLTGEGINTTASGSTITIAAELATSSNAGVATFNTNNFLVTYGDVEITTIDGGTF